MSLNKNSLLVVAASYQLDALAADLVAQMRELAPQARLIGFCGPYLQYARLENWLSLTGSGFDEPWYTGQKLSADFIFRKNFAKQVLERANPHAILAVGLNQFLMRLLAHGAGLGADIYTYAPQAGNKDLVKLPRLKQVLGIYPGEEEHYQKLHVPYLYCGLPIMEQSQKVSVTRGAFGFDEGKLTIGFLPAAEPTLLRAQCKALREAINHFGEEAATWQILFNRPDGVRDQVVFDMCSTAFGEATSQRPLPKMHFVRGMAREIMAVSDLVLAGTDWDSLSCTSLGAVHVALTPDIHSKNIVNHLNAGQEVVSEFALGTAPKKLALLMNSLIQDPQVRQRAVDQMGAFAAKVGSGSTTRPAAQWLVSQLFSHA